MSDPSTGRSRSWVEVDGEALLRNLDRVRSAAPGAGIVPMIKADAYGLGVAGLLPRLAAARPWALGVAAVAEGEALRGLGWTGRTIVFAAVPPGELDRAAEAGLTPALSTLADLRRWAACAARLGRRLAFHTEVDTGMGRAGFPCGSASAWGAEVAALAGDLLEWEGCFTHFHSADEPDLAPTDAQQRSFEAALAALPPRPGRVAHSANSAAAIRRGGYGMELVRPGIFLYGGGVGAETVPEPVASLRARVALVRDVPAGWSCGYGATYRASRPERWGTLAIGYGDGLPRALAAGGGEALVRGVRVPIVGRISMDVTVVDLSGVPGARPGDVATLIGRDGGEEIALDEVAGRAGTISYEILTGLGRRLPRLSPEGGTRSAAAA